MKKHHLYISVILPILAIVAIGLIILNDDKQHVSAVTPTCPAGGTLLIDGAPAGTNSTIFSGSHTLSFSRTTAADQIAQVLFTFDSETNFVGRGLNSGVNTWSMNWLSNVSAPGPHSIGALIKTATGTCAIPPIGVIVDNPTGMMPFNTLASPGQFTDYTNVSRDFMLQTSVDRTASVPVDITQWAVYLLGPASHGITSSEQSSNLIRYFSGGVPGQGGFEVRVNYGGAIIPINIPVNVLPAPTTQIPPKETTISPAPATTVSGTSAIKPPASPVPPALGAPSPTPTAVNPTAQIRDNDPIVKLCLIKAISEPRFLLVNSGHERLTPKEFELSRPCFVNQNFVIPVVYSPILATKSVVKDFEVTKKAEVETVSTSTVKKDNQAKPAIKFSGRSAPNTVVLIYVFSEPLVLSTTSNGDGEWSYSLEDPLEPGKHEAYALVNQGDGLYERSSVFNFAIAKASAASSNPNGNSFTVEANSATPADNNYSIKLYVAAVIGLILIVIVSLILYLVRKQKRSIPSLPSQVVTAPKPVYTPPQPFVTPTVITPSVQSPTESASAETIK